MLAASLCSIAVVVGALMIAGTAKAVIKPSASISLLILGLVAFGGFEFVREDLRKPFVLRKLMFVNSVRIPVSATAEGIERQLGECDRFEIGHLRNLGVVEAALWKKEIPKDAKTRKQAQMAEGREVFRLSCSSCHTIDGYLGIRKLVQGKNAAATKTILGKLARPVGSKGAAVSWDESYQFIDSWRGRRMPPFVGSDREMDSLALYLVSLNGIQETLPDSSAGRSLFEEKCVFCHAPGGDWPVSGLIGGRSAEDLYEIISRLPEMNPIMSPFKGTDQQRRDLAEFLVAQEQR
jgi:mono/diheme cytochrome c family protein